MPLLATRAVFMRGGTSKALIFHEADLPADRDERDRLFLAAMGSPDPHLRQLDGMGGGLSSLSKVCVIGPPSRPDADVDYTFAQVAIGAAEVDYAGNCGNMSSAVGPFAVDEGLVPAPADGEAVVRIHNTNTARIIVARFPVRGGRSVSEGDLAIDGVAGTGASIRLDFLAPGGARTGHLLPTGRPVDVLAVEGRTPVRASLVDAANPCVLVAAAELGLAGDETPDEIARNALLLQHLEGIRRAGSVAMGMAPDLETAGRIASIPKVAILASAADAPVLAGKIVAASEVDLLARMISVGQPHRAVPLTGALCIAVACRVPGTVAHALVRPGTPAAPLRIGHPSGVILVAATVTVSEAGVADVPAATVFRTARRLFQGEVLTPT